MTTTIYALIHPQTREVRYIGKTVRRIKLRISQHVYEAKTRPEYDHKSRWVRALLAEGLRPEAIILKVCEGDGFAEECSCIAKARAAGFRLTNRTDGGEGTPGKEIGPTTRAKISAGNKGCRRSEEYKANVSRTQKALWQQPEHRAKMMKLRAAQKNEEASKALVRFNNTEAGRRFHAETTRRRWANPETRAAFLASREAGRRKRTADHPTLFP